MQSKIILTTTALLIILPAVLFFLCNFKELPFGKRLILLFQSVTPRTAGFNTADISSMTDSSQAVMILLMFIGGSPSSTAGGIKTTTFAVLLLNALQLSAAKKMSVPLDAALTVRL